MARTTWLAWALLALLASHAITGTDGRALKLNNGRPDMPIQYYEGIGTAIKAADRELPHQPKGSLRVYDPTVGLVAQKVIDTSGTTTITENLTAGTTTLTP